MQRNFCPFEVTVNNNIGVRTINQMLRVGVVSLHEAAQELERELKDLQDQTENR